jgi:hypothetical protein
MIAAAPHFETYTNQNRELEYLLLGDLRQTLEEPVGPQTSRWLLAILDMILVGRPRVRPSVYLPIESGEDLYRSRSLESGSLIEKLRRLRDRIAHRSGHSALANEIREELREVMLDRMSSAACLYDA